MAALHNGDRAQTKHESMDILLQIVATVLLADFVSGLLHWLEDAYGREEWPITGRLVTKPNILHHKDPRYFTHHSWLQSSWDLMCLGIIVLAVACLCGVLTWQVWLFVVLGSNANQIHKWAHRTPAENGPFINFLQRIRLLQTPRHHAQHHTNPKESHYCVLTNFLNPLLDGIGLWQHLEGLIWKLFRVRRRIDPSVPAAPLPFQLSDNFTFGSANSGTNLGNWQLSQSAFERSQKSRTI